MPQQSLREHFLSGYFCMETTQNLAARDDIALFLLRASFECQTQESKATTFSKVLYSSLIGLRLFIAT